MALKRVWIPSPNYSSRGGSGVRLIVLHTAEGARTIESLGSYFQGNVSASSHVGADDKVNTVGEYVSRPNKSWTQADYNSAAVSIELCGFASWSNEEWMSNHQNMLANCAQWIAEEAKYFGIPITRLSAAQAQSSGRGVCQHVDLGAGGGGHTDCGSGFPMDYVLDMARSGAGPTPESESGEMLASAIAANGSFHVFRAKGKTVSYTWQKKGDTAWHGGEKGKGVAAWSQFAEAPDDIIGITANVSDTGSFNVFVECKDTTYYTYQAKGQSDWHGGQKGKQVAGLTPWAS